MTTVAFRSFAYRGDGPAGVAAGDFANPVLPGFYPDPSVCRVDDDFYLVTSSFAYFPGLPIFHSRDLVNWRQIGHVLDRPSQLDLDGAGVSRGLFAPAIRHDGERFYVVCTNTNGFGNFVVTATDAAGPWSEPAYLPTVSGIDPSLFFDDDGRAYLLHNQQPDGGPLYHGHRVLVIESFDRETLSVDPTASKILLDGGIDRASEPRFVEAPHLFKRDGWYYLIAAEGGTQGNHAEVVLRSRSATGPYTAGPGNPFLTQRDADPSRPDPITCCGHADLVQTAGGDWWTVFLGCRPFEGDGNKTTLGRETFLRPVDWSGDWPVVTRPGETMPAVGARPDLPAATESPPHDLVGVPGATGRRLRRPVSDGLRHWSPQTATSGTGQMSSVGQVADFVWTDDFAGPALRPEWVFLRTPRDRWYELGGTPSALRVHPRSVELSSHEHPSFLARRQQHRRFEASVTVDASHVNADAGLVAFQNGEHYLFVGLAARPRGSAAVFVERLDGTTQNPRRIATATLPADAVDVDLKLVGRATTYACQYRVPGGDWSDLGPPLDAGFLTTADAGGFVGTMIGLYARTP